MPASVRPSCTAKKGEGGEGAGRQARRRRTQQRRTEKSKQAAWRGVQWLMIPPPPFSSLAHQLDHRCNAGGSSCATDNNSHLQGRFGLQRRPWPNGKEPSQPRKNTLDFLLVLRSFLISQSSSKPRPPGLRHPSWGRTPASHPVPFRPEQVNREQAQRFHLARCARPLAGLSGGGGELRP